MPTYTIHTRASRADIRTMIASLPAIFAGRAPDRVGMAHGLKMRVAVAFLEKVKLAFITKSRGGTDEAGVSWPKLSKAYLAYGRRFGRGEKADLKRGVGLGRANNRSPGGKDGLLTAAQEKEWWRIYRQNLAWLAAREGIEGAKSKAAAIAWNKLKAQGAKTKLEVYGSREVEILRDTGVLFNSLQPGLLTESGPGASYAPPEGQYVHDRPGELIVGTSVPYAAANHKRRKLWPEPDKVPASWLNSMADSARTGLIAAINALVRGAA